MALLTPNIKGGRNAGIHMSDELISRVDAARGDVKRSTFVVRAVERRLEELEQNSMGIAATYNRLHAPLLGQPSDK